MRSGSGGRRVVRQRLDGDGDARQPLGAAVGGKRAVVDEIDGRERERAAGRDREARACRGRRREAPDAAPRPPRARSPRRAGRPARRLWRAARCRASPPARRCRDGSWPMGDVGVPAPQARSRAIGSQLLRPLKCAAPAPRADASSRRCASSRARSTPEPRPAPRSRRSSCSSSRRAAWPPPASRADAGSTALGVLRRGPRGGRPLLKNSRTKKPPARARGRLAIGGARGGTGRSPRANYIPSRGASRCQSGCFTSPRLRGEADSR